MDQNILSPQQLSDLVSFQYKPVQTVNDPNLHEVQKDLTKTLVHLKKQNEKVQEKTNTLQLLADTLFSKQITLDPQYKEEIKWDIYFYKKYNFQTHLMWVIVGVCVLLNIYSFLPQFLFPGLAGFTLAVTFIYMVYSIWDLTFRDDMNFDEYDFQEYTGTFNRPNDDFNLNVEVDISNCIIREEQYIPL